MKHGYHTKRGGGGGGGEYQFLS